MERPTEPKPTETNPTETTDDMVPRIFTTYAVTTPESAEAGDYHEAGYEDEDGQIMLPDEYEREEGMTAVDCAVQFLQDKGAHFPSASVFHPGVWYSTEGDMDYGDGSVTQYSFHLDGFTPQQERAIFQAMTARR